MENIFNNIVDFWQHIPERIDPVFISIGAIEIRYYGIMYLLAIVVVYLLCLQRLKKENFQYSKKLIDDYFFWAIIAVLLGARLGYVSFYDPSYFIKNPLEIFLPFSFKDGINYTGISGMSYHGALIGIIVGSLIFSRAKKINFSKFADFITPAVPLGYTFGRIGNFLNTELYGRITTVWWGMYFPVDSQLNLRHPSQLYEAFFEGLFLFALLWSLRKVRLFNGFLFLLYIIGYGLVRFFIEFYRQPDPQLGYVLGPLTLGQVLCLFMVTAGLGLFFWRAKYSQKKPKQFQ